jgi:histidine triad (HIT) family protein
MAMNMQTKKANNPVLAADATRLIDITGLYCTRGWKAKLFEFAPKRYNRRMQDSIFTKIIKGEIPSHKIYEDDQTLAFLDIYPVQPGHTLVIPKKQIEFVWDLPDEDYQALMASTLKVAKHLREILGVKYIGERIVGIDVPHAHVQLIPFNDVAEFKAPQDRTVEPNHEALAALAKKLTF